VVSLAREWKSIQARFILTAVMFA
jgi:hypothetical protein